LEPEPVTGSQRTWLTTRYRLFRPADGGFAIYTSAARADVDGTGTALGLLRAAGSLPGTPERDRLWGKAIAAAPAPARTNVRRWEDAALPPATGAHSVRVYTNALPLGDTYDDANLVQIIYLDDSAVLDMMDLRQQIARFIGASKQAFGNWMSAESLGERIGLHGEVRAIPVSHDGLDLARIAADHPGARRFWVIGYDVLQVPSFRSEFVRMEGR
jgi:hypothetical protein